MAAPRPRTAPPGRAILGARGASRAASLAGGSALPLALEQLGDLALARVEELVVHFRPAAEPVDLEQLGRRREPLLVNEARGDRPVPVPGVDLLRILRAEEVHECLGVGRVLRLL